MQPDIYTALSLLLIGMITVFFVLFLVVLGGNLLIAFVNRFLPEELREPPSDSIGKAKVAVITAAVDLFTEGKGIIQKIERKTD